MAEEQAEVLQSDRADVLDTKMRCDRFSLQELFRHTLKGSREHRNRRPDSDLQRPVDIVAWGQPVLFRGCEASAAPDERVGLRHESVEAVRNVADLEGDFRGAADRDE